MAHTRRFVYDETKSQSNLAKHGIDFIAAQELWLDPDSWEEPANMEEEERYFLFGRIGDRHWTAVYTNRGTLTRLISVRRSRRTEVEIYERHKEDHR